MKHNIICDLDGTLALDDHRNHLIQTNPANRKWEEYFSLAGEDLVNEPVRKILELFRLQDYDIHILTGRSKMVEKMTVNWLVNHRIQYTTLTMREQLDRTDDHILKPGWALAQGLTPETTLLVLEDRQRVVDAWRRYGYTCLQVAPGAF